MNPLFDKSISEGAAKHEDFMDLIARIDEDPHLLDTLPLETLKQVNAYYDKKISELEGQLADLT